MDPRLARAIQEAFDDAFDAGEVEEVVSVPMQGGQVMTLRSQPEQERPKPSFLSRCLPRVLRDRKRVGEGMGK